MVDGKEVQEAGQKLSKMGRKFWHQLESDKAREALLRLEQVINHQGFIAFADSVMAQGS